MISYLIVAGYSTAVGEKNNASLYFAGAPRFEYKGCVVLFMHDGSKWNPVERTKGDQVSSALRRTVSCFPALP